MRVWEIPTLIVFVLHQHNSVRKVFDELLHQSFLFLLILLEFSAKNYHIHLNLFLQYPYS